jgi:hypothetical protein
VVGEVVDRVAEAVILYITTTPGVYYDVIYLLSRRRKPKSIFYTNPLSKLERQESGFVAYWWRICGAGGAGTFGRCLRTLDDALN